MSRYIRKVECVKEVDGEEMNMIERYDWEEYGEDSRSEVTDTSRIRGDMLGRYQEQQPKAGYFVTTYVSYIYIQ